MGHPRAENITMDEGQEFSSGIAESVEAKNHCPSLPWPKISVFAQLAGISPLSLLGGRSSHFHKEFPASHK